VIFVSLLTLSGWEEIKKRNDQAHGGVGGWIVLAAVLLAALASSGLLRERPADTVSRQRSESGSNAVSLKIPTRVRGESAANPTLRWPAGSSVVKISFFVAVQQGYEYLSELDGGRLQQLDFREDGQMEQPIPRSCLRNGTHRLRIYKHKHDSDVFNRIETFQFETTDGN
jgi:hypothetical protein